MKHFIIFLIAASAAFAQLRDAGRRELTPLLFSELGAPNDGAVAYCSNCTQANPTAAGGPGAFVRREAGVWNGGGGSGGGGAAYEPCKATTAGAVLTIAQPCAARWQNVRVGPTTAQTLTITGGSGTTVVRVYMSESGQLYAEHTTSAGITFSATSGLTPLSVTTPSYGTDMAPIAEVQITSGAWGAVSSQFANMSRDPIVAGADMVITNVSGRMSIAAGVNLARLGGLNDWTGNNSFAIASKLVLRRGASDPATCEQGEVHVTAGVLKVCSATNTWTAAGGGGGSTTVELTIPTGDDNRVNLLANGTDISTQTAGITNARTINFLDSSTGIIYWSAIKASNSAPFKVYGQTNNNTDTAQIGFRLKVVCQAASGGMFGSTTIHDADLLVTPTGSAGYRMLTFSTTLNQSACSNGDMLHYSLARAADASTQALKYSVGTYVP